MSKSKGKRHSFTLRMPTCLRDQAAAHAARMGMNFSDYVLWCCQQRMEAEDKREEEQRKEL